jgi:hypothetical protein
MWAIVAFIPTCSCERETASQTFVSEGISTMGVGNVSGTGDSVTDGIGVAVRVGRLVYVGDGSSVFVEEGVAVSGAEVEDGVATISVGGGAVDVVRIGNEG